MNEELRKMLDEEYERTLADVSEAKTASEEAKWNLQKLTELQRQMNADDKANLDAVETKIKVEQVKESKKDRKIKTILEIAGIVIPTGASCYWMAKGLKFETTGTYTSRTGQWLSNHFKLFKK